MAKYPSLYTEQDLDEIMSQAYPSIFVLKNGDVLVGFLDRCQFTHCYTVVPPTTNRGGTIVGRYTISKIILFNGTIFPKGHHMNGYASSPRRSRSLDILELSELIGKAGYEFI